MEKSKLERARSYLARMPASLQHSGGSTAVFNAARVLVMGFDLTPNEAFAPLAEWNAVNAVPPWGEGELHRKIKEAGKSTGQRGYLLANGGNRHGTASVSVSYTDAEARKKEEQRKDWPAFRALSDESQRRIAALRNVSREAVSLLHHSGILRGAVVDGHRCFIFHDGAFAQARRMDGGQFKLKDGQQIKAKNLPGSQGAFLGRKWLGAPGCPVLLVEGAVALLEAVSAALSVNADLRQPHGWTVVAATSAVARFDAEWLHRLQNRRVRIVPDNDAAGLEACGKWNAGLRGKGCTVDAIRLPSGFKDLGAAMESPDFPAIASAIFTL